MSDVVTDRPRRNLHTHLVRFDGHCGLCSGLVQFILTHDRNEIFRFAPQQDDSGGTIRVVANYGEPDAREFDKARAVLFVARALGWPWKAMGLFGTLPAGLLDWMYDAVARNRYRVFGRREQCFMPRDECRDRFVE